MCWWTGTWVVFYSSTWRGPYICKIIFCYRTGNYNKIKSWNSELWCVHDHTGRGTLIYWTNILSMLLLATLPCLHELERIFICIVVFFSCAVVHTADKPLHTRLLQTFICWYICFNFWNKQYSSISVLLLCKYTVHIYQQSAQRSLSILIFYLAYLDLCILVAWHFFYINRD